VYEEFEGGFHDDSKTIDELTQEEMDKALEITWQ